MTELTHILWQVIILLLGLLVILGILMFIIGIITDIILDIKEAKKGKRNIDRWY